MELVFYRWSYGNGCCSVIDRIIFFKIYTHYSIVNKSPFLYLLQHFIYFLYFEVKKTAKYLFLILSFFQISYLN